MKFEGTYKMPTISAFMGDPLVDILSWDCLLKDLEEVSCGWLYTNRAAYTHQEVLEDANKGFSH